MRTAKPFIITAGFVVLLVGAVAAALLRQQFTQEQDDFRQPPDAVSLLSLTAQNPLTLTWRPPANRDLAGYMLRVSEFDFPPTIDDGDLFADICPSSSQIVLDLAGRPAPQDYFFSLFAYDREGLASEAAQIRLYCDLDSCIFVPDPDKLNRIRSAGDAADLRAWYIAQFWENGRLPDRLPDEITARDDNGYPEASRIETLLIRMEDGLESTAWVFSPAAASGRLMLFHQGHGADMHEDAPLIRELLRNGFHVIAFNMPLEGSNPSPSPDVLEHNDLSAFNRPLHFFIEPIAVALNYAAVTFKLDRIAMMGISGGGWTTSMAAAVDTRIEAAYSVAGGYPVYVRDQIRGNDGDLEQRSEAFWGQTDYLEMFILAGEGRRYVQFFIYHDPCCSQQGYSRTFSAYVGQVIHRLGGEYLAVIDYETREHTISAGILKTILEMEKRP